MNPWPFPDSIKGARVMIFVDGENLAIRYGAMLEQKKRCSHVSYMPNVYVWSSRIDMSNHVSCEVVRCYYYTALKGDESKRIEVHEAVKELGIQAPRVFAKTQGKGSKQVDVSLTVDMLHHAQRGNYDAAVLVAGDEDYIPLVKAVMDSGRRVFLWFVSNGLNPSLRRSCDHFFDLDKVFFDENFHLTAY